MNTGDEGQCSAQLSNTQYMRQSRSRASLGAGSWRGVSSRVSSKLALFISMSVLVSSSELLLALVGSSELCPLFPVSRAGGWWRVTGCPAEVSNNKEAVTHPHQPPARPQQPTRRTENWKYIRQLWHRVNNLPSPSRHGHTGLQSAENGWVQIPIYDNIYLCPLSNVQRIPLFIFEWHCFSFHRMQPAVDTV